MISGITLVVPSTSAEENCYVGVCVTTSSGVTIFEDKFRVEALGPSEQPVFHLFPIELIISDPTTGQVIFRQDAICLSTDSFGSDCLGTVTGGGTPLYVSLDRYDVDVHIKVYYLEVGYCTSGWCGGGAVPVAQVPIVEIQPGT